MNRKRGTFPVPEEMQTTERLFTKKELAQKGIQPTCPCVPKVKRNISNQHSNKKPTPLCFNNNVTLSPTYDPKQLTPYLDQVYTKFGCMGEGSFGKVYRVKSKEDKKLYAVKKLKANISFKDRYAEVKNNEIVGFDPNCVQFHMAWEENGETFMLLEYCDMSLTDYSKVNNNIPEDLLWNVLFDMCKALNFLHKRNLLHLDVKPGNIMMKKGYYKLGDFGLLVDLQMGNHVHKSTLSDGDSKYLAIEVLDGIYTTACDVFGLGLTIFELATDIELPDHGPLWHQLRHSFLPSECYQVSLGLKVIVERMITREYKARPSAEKILSYSSLKKIAKRDSKLPRIDFAAPFVKEDDSYDTLPLSPIHFNNNNDNTTTPPCGFRPPYNDDDCPTVRLRECDEENSNKFTGRKSLFSRLNDQNSPFNSSAYSSFNDSRMEAETDIENSSLARSLNETGIDFATGEAGNTNNSPLFGGSLVTSTPILKTKHSRRIPKAKLTFD